MVQKNLVKGLVFSVRHEDLVVTKTDEDCSFVIPSTRLDAFKSTSQMIAQIKAYVFGNPKEAVSLFIEPEAYSVMINACDSDCSY